MAWRSQLPPGQQVPSRSSTSYAAIAASSSAVSTSAVPVTRKKHVFRLRATRGQRQVNNSGPSVVDTGVLNINPRGVHLPPELIATFLASFVQCHDRRREYALFIRKIHFWSCEKFWIDSASSRPTFSGLQSLELYDTALRDNGAQELIPYLPASLRRLVVYHETSDPISKPETNDDDLWLAYIAASCPGLSHLYLDLELCASPHVLNNLFASCQQLQKLTLTNLVETALNMTTPRTIFALPVLEVLDFPLPLTLNTVSDLTSRSKTLPAIRELIVRFLEGAGHAPSLLLDVLPKLRHLEMFLGNSATNWQPDLDCHVFKAVGNLECLRTLLIHLYPGLDISDTEFANFARLQSLRRLEITEMTILAEEEHDLPWRRSALQVTGSQMLQTLTTLDLDCFQIELVSEAVQVTYDEAVLIDHQLCKITHCRIMDFSMVANDPSCLEWPTEADWVCAIPAGAWLPTNKAYKPDSSLWEYRDLTHGMSRAVEIMGEHSLLDITGSESDESSEYNEGDER